MLDLILGFLLICVTSTISVTLACMLVALSTFRVQGWPTGETKCGQRTVLTPFNALVAIEPGLEGKSIPTLCSACPCPTRFVFLCDPPRT